MTIFLETLYNTLALAGAYGLIAIGITLVYGLTRIVNFAQGELVTIGAFVAFTLSQHGLPIPLALVAAAVVVGLGSGVLYWGLFQRTLDRPLNGFIVSLGLIVGAEAAYALIWGPDPYSIDPVFGGVWKVGSIIIGQESLLLIVATAAVATTLIVTLRSTVLGAGIRALAEDRTAARLLGVPVRRLLLLTFMVGSTLAALAGALLGTLYPFTAYFGPTFLLDGFAIAVIGGLGNVQGAVVAAILVAACQTFGGAYVSLTWAPAFGLIAMIVVILIRPQGLFRGTESETSSPLGTTGVIASISRARTSLWRQHTAGPRAAMMATLLVIGLLPLFVATSGKTFSLCTYALVCAIATYGIWFSFRFAGVFSMAQGAMLGVGAYTAALTVSHWHVGFWLQLAFAVVVSACVAATIGIFIVRTTGSYFLIMMFAFATLVDIVLTNWVSLTNGPGGLIMASSARPLGGIVDFGKPAALYYLVFAFVIVTMVALSWLGRGGFGVRLTTVRDNMELAESLGLNTKGHQLVAFVVSGMVGGAAGVLLLYDQIGVDPTLFTVNAGISLALMMVFGGVGTLTGPLVGAFAVTLLPQAFGLSGNWALVATGAALIVVILALPLGIVGTLRQIWATWVPRSPRARQSAADEGVSP
jgi:branched-chain amino acid transport system permease protein